MSWPDLEFRSADTAFFFYGSAVLCAYVAAAVTASVPATPAEVRTASTAYAWRPMPVVATARTPDTAMRPPAPSTPPAERDSQAADRSYRIGSCTIGQAPLDPTLPVDATACEDALHAAAIAGHD